MCWAQKKEVPPYLCNPSDNSDLTNYAYENCLSAEGLQKIEFQLLIRKNFAMITKSFCSQALGITVVFAEAFVKNGFRFCVGLCCFFFSHQNSLPTPTRINKVLVSAESDLI